jgi:cobalamin biosynthesis protein CbiG
MRPAQLALGGLALVLEPSDPRSALVESIAAELAKLLGVKVVVVTGSDAGPSAAPSGKGFAPIRVTIAPGDAGARTLAALATAVETFLVPR